MIIDPKHGRNTSYASDRPVYYKNNKCCMCNKWTQHKPWDNDERKRRCSKCYDEYCHQEAELIHARINAKNTQLEAKDM